MDIPRVDALGAPPPGPQAAATADPSGIAPREGPVVLADGRFLDAGKCRRFVAGVLSMHFGEAVYLTPTQKWVHYTPGSFLAGPEAREVRPAEALAFLLREGLEVPPQLRPVARELEV